MATPGPVPTPTDPPALEAPERKLQEIASVGRHLEAMDLKITDLTIASSSSIHADIAGFKDTAEALDQRLTAVEDQMAALPDQETKLRSLRAEESRTLAFGTSVIVICDVLVVPFIMFEW
ncbi:hypothetical protein NDU88_004606 [Pleurodeles waltl]|uniref:Uncharacterized protein n=1 Tax=Pleurodeles waltl TaxID=8319 RepID=A0AAV7RGQ5_PLEWA|nr:hypothetical protein NDU88_004606 [Pleurodeles waltl]